MSHEAIPIDDAEQALLTGFETSIYDQIQARGDDNHIIDRYERQLGTPLLADFDYQYDDNTGDIKFGGNFLTHRIDIDEFQLIYAFKPRTTFVVDEAERFILGITDGRVSEDTLDGDNSILSATAELYVHEFGETGQGCIARTVFSENEAKDSITKTRVSRFGAINGLGLVDLRRTLRAREKIKLGKIIESPEEHVIALRSLTSLTKSEQRKAQKAQREYEGREEELRQALAAIAEARHAPIPDMFINS